MTWAPSAGRSASVCVGDQLSREGTVPTHLGKAELLKVARSLS